MMSIMKIAFLLTCVQATEATEDMQERQMGVVMGLAKGTVNESNKIAKHHTNKKAAKKSGGSTPTTAAPAPAAPAPAQAPPTSHMQVQHTVYFSNKTPPQEAQAPATGATGASSAAAA